MDIGLRMSMRRSTMIAHCRIHTHSMRSMLSHRIIVGLVLRSSTNISIRISRVPSPGSCSVVCVRLIVSVSRMTTVSIITSHTHSFVTRITTRLSNGLSRRISIRVCRRIRRRMRVRHINRIRIIGRNVCRNISIIRMRTRICIIMCRIISRSRRMSLSLSLSMSLRPCIRSIIIIANNTMKIVFVVRVSLLSVCVCVKSNAVCLRVGSRIHIGVLIFALVCGAVLVFATT